MEKLIITSANAGRILEWIRERGGVAVWHSIDLSDPATVSTPYRERDGALVNKPHWKLDQTPAQVITDPADIEVVAYKEVRRFRVGVRRGSQGFSLKVTAGGSRRIRAALAKVGEDATYEFDYASQEAVILVPERRVPLSEYNPLIHA